MGEPDKVNLQSELESAGWRVERHESDQRWTHETWELASTWRPVGVKAFLALLVDPMSEKSDISSVWAISITRNMPADWVDAGHSVVRVSPRWPERMKEIVAAVNSLRPIG